MRAQSSHHSPFLYLVGLNVERCEKCLPGFWLVGPWSGDHFRRKPCGGLLNLVSLKLCRMFVSLGLPQTAAAGGEKARKRQRDDQGGSAPSKRGKEGAAGKPQSSEGAGAAARKEEDKVQQLVKTGFFSDVEFSALPLSSGMLSALAKLNFVMTTKIQVGVETSTQFFMGGILAR